MESEKKVRGGQSFLQGAMILSIAMVLVKFVGAIFKIPLVSILGDDGSGYFYFSYDIFNLVLSIATAGLPIAVSKVVAESVARGRYRDVKKIMRLSTLIFVITGTIGMLVVFIFARPIVEHYATSENYLAVLCIGPAVLFLCLMSSYRGYYEGLRNMVPTAVSQSVEAVAKTVAGLSLGIAVRQWGLRQFEETGRVFGQTLFHGEPINSLEMARSAVAPYAAAGAILGVTISTFVGFLFLFIYRRVRGDGITKQAILTSPKARSSKKLLKKLVALAVPVCLGSLVLSLSSAIDSATVIRRINDAIAANPEYIQESYSDFLAGQPLEALANKLFGAYKGLTLSIFNLVPSFTTAFGVSALPAVTTSWARRNKLETKRNIESVLRMTSLVAMPAGFGLITMAGPILRMFYGRSNPLGVEVAIPLLSFMGISVMFVALASPINAMLQGIGRPFLPVVFMFVGALLKVISNNVLISRPEINIRGVPVGTLLCYLFIVIAGLIALLGITKIKVSFTDIFLKPIAAGAFCGISAYLSYHFLRNLFGNAVSLFLGVMVGAAFYVVVLILIRGIRLEDIKMLPKGEKILKRLENRKRIG